MENLKSHLLELWNYALLMYRTTLIKAELRRRKSIGGPESRNSARRKANGLLSDENQSENHKNDIINGDAQDPGPATSSKICPFDRLEIKRVFDLFDENKDGLISAKELQVYMKRIGFDLSDQKVRKMVGAVDRNRDDFIDFEEFFLTYCPLSGNHGGDSKSHDSSFSRVAADEEEEEETLLKAFFVFDENKDGFISLLELQQVLLKLGLPEGRSLMGCEKMIQKVDSDGNGKVDFFEFKSMMRSNSFVF